MLIFISRWHLSLPYLLVSFTTDPQHFFALELKLSRESVNRLIQGVDLMVQTGNAIAAGTHICLQVWDTSQEFLFLDMK